MIIPDDFPKKYVAAAVDLSSEGLAGFAWDLARTLEILEYLRSKKEIVVLGGDFYLSLPSKKVIYPLLENWSYEPAESKDNHSISIEKAIKAVEAYKYRPIANDVIVDLVISGPQNSGQIKSPFDFLKTHIQK